MLVWFVGKTCGKIGGTGTGTGAFPPQIPQVHNAPAMSARKLPTAPAFFARLARFVVVSCVIMANGWRLKGGKLGQTSM